MTDYDHRRTVPNIIELFQHSTCRPRPRFFYVYVENTLVAGYVIQYMYIYIYENKDINSASIVSWLPLYINLCVGLIFSF